MTCIIIREDNHGIIGVAANYKSAIKFLIAEGWLSNYTELYSEEKDEEFYLFEWRVDWEEYLLSCNMDEFNTIFDGLFYLEDYDIFNAAE